MWLLLVKLEQGKGEDKAPFIKAYTAHYDDETVHFKIFMTQDQMNTAEEEGFLKKFKLTTTLSTANMHLFDANGVIKKYDTPEQILQEFFDLRLEFYKYRKTALLHELNEAISLLENKVDYIKRILKRGICNLDKEMDVLCRELKVIGFKPFPKEAIPGTEYEYLLSIGNASMSYKKILELKQEIYAKKEEHYKLSETTPESLWRSDLTVLEDQLKEQVKIDDMIRRKQEGAKKMMTYEEEPEDDSDSDEEEPEIAEEAPKKKAPAKRAAASPLPERANKKRLKW
ncbi:DNA topoisomerase 2-like protein [Tanacetum coccineum]